MTKVWEPVRLGQLDLPQRLAMAPMTRDRSTPEGVPTELNALYYGQRASIGLIISEGTQPSEDGQGYLLTPGIHTAAQIAGWRKVSEAVHAGGGRLFIQLMHAGRIAHPENTPHHRQPVGPSAVKPEGKMFTMKGMLDMPEPRGLSLEEVSSTVEDFAHAARCAVEVGADGVEIHGANGYLVQQFLSSNANQRSDRYGGSIDNRVRFGVEVASAVVKAVGAHRVGFRISPGNTYNDIKEDDAQALYQALLAGLAPLGLAYLHLVHPKDEAWARSFRDQWPGALILNRPGAPFEARSADMDAGLADVASVGQLALANPDLVKRLKSGAPLNPPDPSTYFGGDAKGYTDYPALA